MQRYNTAMSAADEPSPPPPQVYEEGDAVHGDDDGGNDDEHTSESEDEPAKTPPKKSGGSAAAWKRFKEGAVRVFNSIKWILLVIVILASVALLARWNVERTKRYSPLALDKVKELIDYAAKSAYEAERTQHDPMQSLLHADYAVCYVNAAKHMVDDETLKKITGNDMAELEQYLKQLQQRAIQLVDRPPANDTTTTTSAASAAARSARRNRNANARPATTRPGVPIS